jgi:hypothetical protein
MRSLTALLWLLNLASFGAYSREVLLQQALHPDSSTLPITRQGRWPCCLKLAATMPSHSFTSLASLLISLGNPPAVAWRHFAGTIHSPSRNRAIAIESRTGFIKRNLLVPMIAHGFTDGSSSQFEMRGLAQQKMMEVEVSAASQNMLSSYPRDAGDFVQLIIELFKLQATPLAIAHLTDAIDYAQQPTNDKTSAFFTMCATQFLKRQRRSQLLVDMMRRSHREYVETVSFLHIPRSELPNREGIPLREIDRSQLVESASVAGGSNEKDLVPDCVLEKVPVKETFLDRFLLEVMRDLYTETGNITRSSQRGILGLLEEVQRYMLSREGSAPAAQQEAVVVGLRTLLTRWTPFLPAFFRIVMGGIVPSYDADSKWLADSVQWVRSRLPSSIAAQLEPGKRYGPTFFAPALMALVAKYSISPLMGPSTLAFRTDGQLGGLVAERCIFLQESNCKGMCLNSCKLPAEQLFGELGLPVRVTPNFETQECNWAFGEKAPPLEEDPTWPKGCVVGCTSRKALKKLKRICE